jgi:radical SAM/Cys-rich protein
MLDTLPLLLGTDFPPLRRRGLNTLQVNLGYRCNQRCLHCHVNAGPGRTEEMDDAQIDLTLQVLVARRVPTLDITGGAPELHPRFRDLVQAARDLGIRVMDRCNLTILSEPGQENLADFLASRGVEIVASLPCYLEAKVDSQRGQGVHARSIAGLQHLNALGYGQVGSGLVVDLVYNPGDASLPPGQALLEATYKRELWERYGILFNRLLVLTNMPISRFGSTLISRGQFADYLGLLRDNFCLGNLEHVMCRDLISVDWRGRLFDCDFNQQLGLALGTAGEGGRDILGRDPLDSGGQGADGTGPCLGDLLDTDFATTPIAIADHCYGCAAGQGSSCGGALAVPATSPS